MSYRRTVAVTVHASSLPMPPFPISASPSLNLGITPPPLSPTTIRLPAVFTSHGITRSFFGSTQLITYIYINMLGYRVVRGACFPYPPTPLKTHQRTCCCCQTCATSPSVSSSAAVLRVAAKRSRQAAASAAAARAQRSASRASDDWANAYRASAASRASAPPPACVWGGRCGSGEGSGGGGGGRRVLYGFSYNWFGERGEGRGGVKRFSLSLLCVHSIYKARSNKVCRTLSIARRTLSIAHPGSLRKSTG